MQCVKSIFKFQFIGTLGVVTEVTIKIRPVPPIRKYASFVFPDFDFGVKFMRQVARDVCYHYLNQSRNKLFLTN